MTITFSDAARSKPAELWQRWQQCAGKVTEQTNSLTARKTSGARKSEVPLSPTSITDSVILAVDPLLWCSWCRDLGKEVPIQLRNGRLLEDVKHILDCSPPYRRTGGDLYFHIKSDDMEDCRKVRDMIIDCFQEVAEKITWTEGNPLREGRVYGRRILHGLITSVDPVNLSARVLIGDEDPEHRGACFCVSQKFVHNWDLLGELSEIDIESMIGRDLDGNILPDLDRQSHMRCVRARDREDINYRIYNQGNPFGNSVTGPSREEGVFVSAFARSLHAFQQVLAAMLGMSYEEHGEIKDRHLRFSSSVEGNIWYVPSVKELGLEPADHLKPVEINQFFRIQSKSPYLFYNTKDFLHRIWDNRQERYEQLNLYPLTDRIINLLGNVFSRWHNNWYEPPVFPHLPSLAAYFEQNRERYSEDKAEQMLAASIAERKGLAIKLTLGDLFTNE
jgi:deferrochelatase/peroxidase EfeB